MNVMKRAVVILMAILMVFLFCSCQTEKDNESASYTDLSELEGKRIGVTTGSIQAQQAEEHLPDAEFYYFSTSVDMLNALRADKIDAYADAEALVKYMMTENPDLTFLEEKLADGMKVGAIFPKTEQGRELCDEFSEFILKIREDGLFETIQENWFGNDETKRSAPDLNRLTGPNGTLRLAVDASMVPFVYFKDGELAGVDVEIVAQFCEEYGYALEPVIMDFAAILPAITTSKCDFACGGIAFTAERAESVYFSEPTFEGGSVVAVLRPSDTSGEEGFWASLKQSFEKTFIREGRWKLFVKGIANTLLITLLSVIFGTLLGFIVYILCRKGNPLANWITKAFVWLVQGMPMVVLLMVLYYVIFGNVSISGLLVAVVGFSLTFAASTYGMLCTGVKAVDKGQTEAAYALGYTDSRSFFRIVLPQAAAHFLPVYKGQVVSHLKATAVVGYIAVQDLTKMGDIVRSRTYEAFFPLIAVTVLYFILAAILTRIVSGLTLCVDPKHRKPEEILKGVETHD